MKFMIDQDVLLKPLEQVSKALPTKTTIQILNNILFEVEDDGLHLTASDTGITIKAHILASEFEIIETGSITLPGKKIVDIVKKLYGGVTIGCSGKEAFIESGKSKFEITGLDAEEFPTTPELSGESIKLNGAVFKELVNKTIFATSKNQSTSILTGIKFDIFPDKISLLATDRHRLSRIDNNIENGVDFTIVISAEYLSELVKLISDKEDVELSFREDRFIAKTNEFTLYSRVLEGEYPNVSQSIPTEFVSHVTAKTKDLIETLDRVLIVAAEEKTNLVKVIVGDDITFHSKAQNNSVVDGLEYTGKHGEGFAVNLNGKYLLEALKTIDNEETQINFLKELSPIILHGVGNDNGINLILPYRS